MDVKNLINGEWSPSCDGRTLASVNPADSSDVVATVPASTNADVDAAIEAARSAFNKWRLVPAPKRGEILFRAAERLLREKDRLGRLVTREMGKILPEGLGDAQEAIDMAYYMAGEGRRLSAETVPSELPDKDCKSVRVPIGVVAAITPWNFPIAIPSWKVLPALITGNTVVLKPSSYTAACAYEFARIMHEAGLPPGVLNLVNGQGSAVGEYLACHKGADCVSFTGSSAVGERLKSLLAGSRKDFSSETGGKNPIIVMDDAMMDLAVEGALWGAFGTAGQRCTAASRIIVHRDALARFTRKFVDRASKLKVGDGMDASTHVGPVINEEQLKKILGYVDIGKAEGATLALGGRRLSGGAYDKGYFIEPTIFTDVLPGMRIAQEEIFGPIVSIIGAEDFNDAIKIANGVEYGLAASIYTSDVNRSAEAERELDAGIVYINAPTIGAEIQLPFGGAKRSGLGHKEAGGRGGALDMFSKFRVIYRDFSGRLQKAQISDDKRSSKGS
jgi:aldehyde dehydrogenase (NAD+)